LEDDYDLSAKTTSATMLPEEDVWQDWETAAIAPDTDAAAAEADDLRHHRHLPGTWKIWEGTWFYATKTPGWIDVKIILKHQFRAGVDGLGTTNMSRTLTPHHYGDVWEDPWRTLLLLRSWSIWRARWQGWARAKEHRLREVGRQVARFTADLRQAHAEHEIPLTVPLLGDVLAHQMLLKWTADAVSAVLA
jgi:hypothetical protein